MAKPTKLTAEQRRIVRSLVSKHDPLIRQAFEAAIQNARGLLDFDALVAAISSNNIAAAAEILSIRQAALFPLEEAVRTAFIAGGLSVSIPKSVGATFSFNGRHPRAEQIIAETGARFVTEIGSPGVEAVRDVVLQAQKEGIGAQATARRLAGTIDTKTGLRKGGIMGLDGPRAQRSTRVREILSDPDQIHKYFIGDKPRYKSTDRRFDARVRKAIAEGRALDKATINKIAKAHDARLLKARGKTIAEHEAFTAQAAGRRESYAQLSERDDVERVKKTWYHNTLNNARDDHQRMDGTTVDFDEAFVMDDGTRMQMPHDPDAPTEHTIGCRCTAVYEPIFVRKRR